MNKKFKELSKEEKREYWKLQRRKKGVPERLIGLIHGRRSSYSKYGCRCSDCSEANKTYYRKLMKEKGRTVTEVMGWGKEGQLRFIQKKIKEESICTDCKQAYPYYVLQFDHVPERGDKKFTISIATRNSSVTPEELLEEIKKCDIVCANCHFKRTYERNKKD